MAQAIRITKAGPLFSSKELKKLVATSCFTAAEYRQLRQGQRPHLQPLTHGGPVRAYCLV
jgi:hypothetical protein